MSTTDHRAGAEGTASAVTELLAQRCADEATRVEIEQFLFIEAELLDTRRFREWFALLADDVRYWMPIRINRDRRDPAPDHGDEHHAAHFDDDKGSLLWRVKQLETGTHWAEVPPSRTRHLVSNVRVSALRDGSSGSFATYDVRSNFLCYRNRGETEVDTWVGERHDELRQLGPYDWQIARRTILLDQAVVLSKNLSVLL